MARKIQRLEENFAGRLREAFRWAGYWDARATTEEPDGRPDVGGFAGSVKPSWNDAKDRKSLYSYLRGPTVPALPTLIRLANQLGVPVSWFAFGVDAFKEIEDLIQLQKDLKARRPYRKHDGGRRANTG